MDSGAESFGLRRAAPGDPDGDGTAPADRAGALRPAAPPPDTGAPHRSDDPDTPSWSDAGTPSWSDATGTSAWSGGAETSAWSGGADAASWADETDRSTPPHEAAPTPDRVEWRVRPAATVLKGVGAVAFVGAGLWAGRTDRVGLAIGLAGAVVLAALALRDLVLSVSLAADREGVTVRGLLGHRRVPWSEVERIRVDRRSRRGIRSELVEIDCDTELHLFGRTQLGGADCADVVRQLTALRPTA
jgi:hypothetical protein